MKAAPTFHGYDARLFGATCDLCPLNGRIQVPPKPADSPLRLVVVAEGPGRNEEIEGEPFLGAGGMLKRNLTRLNVDIAAVHKTNVTMCRPPIKKLTPKEWKLALKCCRPRLEHELVATGDAPILAIGGRALQSLCGKAKIIPWRGSPLSGLKPFEHRVITPTVHPAFILRGKAQWEPVFRIDLGRALNPKPWRWPEIVIEEGDLMRDALRRIANAKLPIGVDVETAGIDPMFSGLLCIGVANTDVAVSVPWPPANDDIRQAVVDLLADASIEKVMHNGQHDRLTLEAAGVPANGSFFDTLLAHAIAAPTLPHDLGFVASCEFPAPRWKSIFRVETDLKGGEAFTKRDPLELRDYNAKDAYMTALLRAT